MGLGVGSRIRDGKRRGTVLEVKSTGIARVAWDEGGISHPPVSELCPVGKDAG
jgi:hypothetical protein